MENRISDRKILQSAEDLIRVILCINLLDDFGKDTVLIKDEGLSDSSHYGLSVHLLFAPCPEGLKKLSGCVGQKRERKFVLFSEFLVRCHAILAHTYNVITFCLKGLIIISKAACFCCASAGIVLRIEIYDRLLSEQVLAAHSLAVLVLDLEVGHLVSDFEHIHIVLYFAIQFSSHKVRHFGREFETGGGNELIKQKVMFYNFLFPQRFRGKGVSFLILILRIFFGVLFFMHGLDKMTNFNELSLNYPNVMGLGSYTTLMVTIFCEFCCSLFLIAGLITRIVTIPMIVAMGVAFFDIHDAMMPEGELSLIYMVTFFVFFIMGPGRYSVDYLLDRQFKKEQKEA